MRFFQACNTMSRFPPSSPRDAFKIVPTPMSDDDHPTPLERLPKTVFVPIVLTRPLYSQLVLQRFFAPKVFEKVGWSDGEKGGEEERRRAVGMKIVSRIFDTFNTLLTSGMLGMWIRDAVQADLADIEGNDRIRRNRSVVHQFHQAIAGERILWRRDSWE